MKRRDTGSSLVEALVATLVFAISASAVGSALTFGFVTIDSTASRQHAVALAESSMEDLRGLPYEDLGGSVTTDHSTGKTFTITSIVDRDRPADNMSEISVGVGWNERGRARSYGIRTIYASVQR